MISRRTVQTVKLIVPFVSISIAFPLEERSHQMFEFNRLQEWFSTCNTDIGRVQVPYMLKTVSMLISVPPFCAYAVSHHPQ